MGTYIHTHTCVLVRVVWKLGDCAAVPSAPFPPPPALLFGVDLPAVLDPSERQPIMARYSALLLCGRYLSCLIGGGAISGDRKE